jgi:hypothetical protein
MVRFRATFAGLLILAIAVGIIHASRHAFAEGAGGVVGKIALLPCAEPDKYIAENLAHPAYGFGLLGRSIASDDVTKDGDLLTQALRGQQIRIGDAMTNALETALRAQNYEVVRVKAVREKPSEFVDNYKLVETDADAILDIALTHAGYMRTKKDRVYTPLLRLEARLVSAAGRRKIFSDVFAYGRSTWSDDNPTPDQKYIFKEFSELLNAIPQAQEGLETGVAPLATLVVAKMRQRLSN